MAGMFGFPSFKESPLIKVPKGKGGYWYRSLTRPSVINLKCHFYTLFRQKEHFPEIDILIRTAYNKSIPSAFYPGTCLKKTILRSACPGK